MADKAFTGDERNTELATVPDWKDMLPERDAISRTFLFADFKDAWKFMSKTADFADPKDHHPEWFNVYNKVEVTLATHTASGVTAKDIELASAMDTFAKECGVKAE